MNNSTQRDGIRKLYTVHQGEQGQDRSAYLPSKSPLRTMSSSFYKQFPKQPSTQRVNSKSKDRMPLYEALLGDEFLGKTFCKKPYFYNLPTVKSEKRTKNTTRAQSTSLLNPSQVSAVGLNIRSNQKSTQSTTQILSKIHLIEIQKDPNPKNYIWKQFFENKEFTIAYQKQLCQKITQIVESVECSSCMSRVESIISTPIEMSKNDIISQLFFQDSHYKQLEGALSKSILLSMAQLSQQVPNLKKAQNVKHVLQKENRAIKKKLSAIQLHLVSLQNYFEQSMAESQYFRSLANVDQELKQQSSSNNSILKCIQMIPLKITDIEKKKYNGLILK